jgi:hypothetical protein
LFWESSFAWRSSGSISAFFRRASWTAHLRKNRLKALLDPLGSQTLLRFLPGKGFVFHNWASQEEQPAGDSSQFTPAVADFFGLEARLGSAPALASLAIFQFMWVWNDLLVALIYLGSNPQLQPMTVDIANLVSSLGAGWQLLTAAAFLSMILPLIIFLSLQRYFVRGILAGSVKG